MNRKIHNTVGITSGAIVAFARSDGQDIWKRLAESVGGGLGGYFGARLPDILEPPVSSWHRDFAHSATVGASLVVAAKKTAGFWEACCRAGAEEFAVRRRQPHTNRLQGILYLVVEVALHVAAGFLSGVAVGYVSHLLCDATTPRSIPLLTKALV